MRFAGTCFRAHDPRWSFSPLSGEGARLWGGRFNPRGMPALYLSLSISTAVKEANQGFARKIEPCVLCSYDVDCADIADLRHAQTRRRFQVSRRAMSCAWFELAARGREPPSWAIARKLMSPGHAGALVPSFVNRATAGDQNLVLWKWGKDLPYRISVYDPGGKLPKNQLSWGLPAQGDPRGTSISICVPDCSFLVLRRHHLPKPPIELPSWEIHEISRVRHY